VDAGAFDYAADAWGFTYGAAAEWTQSRWTLRGGLFALSQTPNNTQIQGDFSQYSMIGELEERHQWLGHPGKLKLLIFDNRGRMAKYADAVQLANQTGNTPDPALSRHFNSRAGVGINLEQELIANVGFFARASLNDGSKEAYDFTDINKSLSGGLSIKGNAWGRPDDTVGIAGAINGISHAAQQYFAAGGLGILVGDGQLTNYSTERIFETYYSLRLNSYIKASMDYQYIDNPAYNQDRGPVSVVGLRLHAEL
jgi:high affinity Mn2+ porin